jgi:outer membrane usher protein FimD/PapC
VSCFISPVDRSGNDDPEVSPALKTTVALLACALGMSSVLAQTPPATDNSAGDFDAEILKQRGIDPRLASFFKEAARFTPGTHTVKLTVNGHARGRTDARIDEQGSLCFTAALLDAAGLLLPAGAAAPDAAGAEACLAFLAAFPLTQVELRPDVGEITLLVPAQAIRASARDVSGFSSGGKAGILNYELLGMANRFAQGSSHNISAATELGFNAGDWIVRSRQLYTSANGQSQMQHLDAYAQRTFAEHGLVFQAGQIGLANPVLGGAQVTGIQILNEQALAQQGTQARVDGIAQGPARVEVRQNDSLVYTTVVPGGPFSLTNVPRINPRTDLDVSVIEADGTQHSFTVSAALAGVEIPASGYVFGIGRARNLAGASEAPWVASAGWSGGFGRGVTISGGALAATDYAALGASLGSQPWFGAQGRFDLLATRASDEGVNGMQARLTLSQSLGKSWSFNAAASHQTLGYRELLDATFTPGEAATRARNRDQFAAGLGWSNSWLGSLSASYSQSSLFDGTSNRRAVASWGRSLWRASLSVSAEYGLGGNNTAGNALYASLSMPLGERTRVRTTVRDSGGSQRLGISLNGNVNDAFSYRLGSERNLSNDRTSLTAGASLLPRYAQLDFGYAGNGSDQNSLTAGLRGGLVLHAGGITPSPYPIQDTFGLVSVGDVAGVKVSTPGGPVWTDVSGQAVIAQLNPYTRSTVEVVPKSLPRNVDLRDGAAEITAGRGAVERVDFGVTITRRVLLEITTAAGEILPAGAAVTDSNDQPVGIVEQGGQVFLPNALNLPQLWVSGPDLARCELHFELPTKVQTKIYYETVPAVCRTPEPGKQE